MCPKSRSHNCSRCRPHGNGLPSRDNRDVAAPPVIVSAGMPTATPVEPAATVADVVPNKVKQFLEPEVQAGRVQVFEDAQTITIRLTNRSMFASGAATLAASITPLFTRIGDALNDEKGDVAVYGYTDDQPIRTARFPSNFELSQARAEAVGDLLRARLTDPKRLRAQGKGQNSPIASNATLEGRQENRRTEIVLLRTPDGM